MYYADILTAADPDRRRVADRLLVPGDAHLVVLGDFNIFNRDDATFEKLSAAGFVVPEPLQAIPGSNVDRTKHYDQIAFLGRRGRARRGARGRLRPLRARLQGRSRRRRVGRRALRSGPDVVPNLADVPALGSLPMWAGLDVGAADAYIAAAAKGPQRRGESGERIPSASA